MRVGDVAVWEGFCCLGEGAGGGFVPVDVGGVVGPEFFGVGEGEGEGFVLGVGHVVAVAVVLLGFVPQLGLGNVCMYEVLLIYLSNKRIGHSMAKMVSKTPMTQSFVSKSS